MVGGRDESEDESVEERVKGERWGMGSMGVDVGSQRGAALERVHHVIWLVPELKTRWKKHVARRSQPDVAITLLA